MNCVKFWEGRLLPSNAILSFFILLFISLFCQRVISDIGKSVSTSTELIIL